MKNRIRLKFLSNKSSSYVLCGAFFILFLLNHSISVVAQDSYLELSPRLVSAYNNAIELKLDLARKDIQLAEREEPNNVMRLHIENYIDFFQIFIKEEKSDFKNLEKLKDKRIKQIRKTSDENPLKLFSEAEINLQWALLRLKFGEYIDAAFEITRANALLEENEIRFPDFVENKKSLAIIHSLAESTPSMVRSIMGIEGSIQQGMQEIKELYDYSQSHHTIFEKEIIAIYAYMLYYQLNKREEAYDFLLNSSLKPNQNLLSTFLVASMAMRNGHNDEALKILENRPHDPDMISFYYLDFMQGKCLLSKLDPGANEYILKFTDNFKGRHYIKEAYQKLAWCELVENNDLAAYKKYMALCVKKGEDLLDEDKQALKEAKETNIPNADLLKARILFDGGYFQKAYKILALNSYKFLSSDSGRLEYLYRLGRVLQNLKNYPEALNNYEQLLQEGNGKTYFECSAALQAGMIYEEQGEPKEAKKFYHKCLDLSPDNYKTSLHQKAKSALNRLNK